MTKMKGQSQAIVLRTVIAVLICLCIAFVAVYCVSGNSAVAYADGNDAQTAVEAESNMLSRDNVRAVASADETDTYAAKIGDVSYATFEDALAALSDGDTLTLLNNVTISADVEITKNIVFDLNGKTLNGNFEFKFTGKVTINDSGENGKFACSLVKLDNKTAASDGEYNTVVNSGIFDSLIYVNGNNVKIHDGTFNNYISFSGENIFVTGGEYNNGENSDALSIQSKSITITAGTFNRNVDMTSDSAVLTVTGGTFNQIDAWGTFTMTGGTLEKLIVTTHYTTKPTVKLSGGIIKSFNIGSYTYDMLLADGYAYYSYNVGGLPSTSPLELAEVDGGAVRVDECRHSYSRDTHKCIYCNMDCPHTFINDGQCVDCSMAFEAKIGNVLYSTFEDALAALSDGDTLTLLSNVTISQNVEITPNIVFDLNGKTLDGDFEIKFSGKVTINDSGGNGKFACSLVKLDNKTAASDGEYNTVVNGGIFDSTVWVDGNNVKIADGTFNGYMDFWGENILVAGGEYNNGENSDSLTISSKSITITDGTFNRNVDINSSEAEVTIKGGTFKQVETIGTLTITEGTLEKLVIITRYSDKPTVQISGGIIKSFDIGSYTYDMLLADGYAYYSYVEGGLPSTSPLTLESMDGGAVRVDECRHSYSRDTHKCIYCNMDCPHTFINYGQCVDCSIMFEAKIGDVSYLTFEDALAALSDGDTLTLLNNVTISQNVEITQNIVFDLNGKTLNGNFELKFTGKVTINDSGENGKFACSLVKLDNKTAAEDGEYNTVVNGGIFGNKVYVTGNNVKIVNGTFNDYTYFSGENILVSGGEYNNGENSDALTISSKSITITGGTFNRNVNMTSGSAVLTVTGGTFNQIDAWGTFTMTGGTIGELIVTTQYTTQPTVRLSGGIIKAFDIGSYTYDMLLADGYAYYSYVEGGLPPTSPLLFEAVDGCAVQVHECRHSYSRDTHKCIYCNMDCPHEHWSGGECSACGIACEHTGGTATCVDKATCTVCGEKYGAIDPDNHAGEKVWSVKTENEHAQEWSCCHESVVERENHEWHDGVCSKCEYICLHAHWTSGICDVCGEACTHTGGTATCVEKATCTVCGEKYGAFDVDNHVGEKVWNVMTDTEHAQEWSCCHAPVVERENHEWNNGVCSECEYICEHAHWTNGTCDVCGAACAHECWSDGICDVCGHVCEHAHWTDGVCDVCEAVCTHTGGTATCVDKATCTVCGEKYGELDCNNHIGEKVWSVKTETEHAQEWSCCHESVVEKENHEWHDGVCSECEYVCAHANWEGGVCEVCGEACTHTGGTATCVAKAKCTICGEEYGEIDASHHSGILKTTAVAATVTSEGNIEYYHCIGCGKYFSDSSGKYEISAESVILKKLAPEIIEGANTQWTQNGENGFSVKSNALRSDYICVLVDDIEISADNYVMADDSTQITFNASYLQALEEGEHTLSVRSASGDATTTFTVNSAPASSSLSVGAWVGIGIAILAALCLLAFVFTYAAKVFKRR